MPDEKHDPTSKPQPALAPAGVAEETEHDEPLDQLSPYFRESALAPEGGEAPPMWLWVAIFGTILIGVYYLGSYVGDFSPYPWLQHPSATVPTLAAAESVDGAQIYQSRCAACHQAGGEGVLGTFPPLAGSEVVQGDKGVLVRVVLHGLSGPIEVEGTMYDGAMPAWPMLSDEEIAAVTTHERSSWGNDAGPISAEEVAAIREALVGRSQPWTADELALPENQGIPRTEGAPPADTVLPE
ncbi:MAG: cytochrome c [Rhodothermales bacterium]